MTDSATTKMHELHQSGTLGAFVEMVTEAVGPGTLRSGAEPLDSAYIESLFR